MLLAVRPGNRWRRFVAGVIIMPCLILSLAGRSASESPSVTDVKAAFIFNFIKFTTWDKAIFPDDDPSLRICVAGNDDLYTSLVHAVNGKTVRGRTLIVFNNDNAESAEIEKCHVFVIGGEDRKGTWKAAARTTGAPVLTVGESDDFVRHGGIIGFRSDGRKLGFEINVANAKTADLEISSKLLQLARVVDE